MARILIVGLAKSGTTGLWSKIVNSYPWRYHSYFEGDYVGQNKKNMICKQLIGPNFDVEQFAHFDNIIWIVRDPRDRLVSYTLYRIFDHRYNDDSFVQEFLGLLRQKEQDSDSVSLAHLERLLELPEPKMQSAFFWNDAAVPKDQGLVLKYEDFIDERLAPLEEYLGRKLGGGANVPKRLARVARTKAYGFWQDWYTDEDVETYKPLFEEFMVQYGYPMDWTTKETKQIDPASCSHYALKLINERRKGDGLPLVS